MDRGEQVVDRGVEGVAAVDHERAEPLEELAHPVPRGDRDDRAAARAQQALGALGDLRAHVGDVELRDLARVPEQRHRVLRLVGVDVDLQRHLVADDEDRVAELLQERDEGAALEARSLDDEVRAVPVAAVLVVGPRVAGRRRVVRDLGRRDVAAQAGDDARP